MSYDTSTSLTPLSSPPAASPQVAKPVSKVRWCIHLAIMAALPVLAGLLGASSHGRGPALTNNARGLLLVCGIEVLIFGTVFGVTWLISRASRDDLLLRWRPGFWVVPLGALYSVAIRVAVGILLVLVAVIVVICARPSRVAMQQFSEAHRPQVETLVDLQALSNDPVYFWLAVIVVSLVMGGLREELWRSSFLAGLRSLWPRVFGSSGGGIAGAAIAALFFGAGHLPQGMLAVAMVTIVGFLLGVIMTLHRSVWPSVVAHGLFDSASIAMIPWAMRHFQELQQVTGHGS
jgi:membrane protease YdiL (CAAX protease family)